MKAVISEGIKNASHWFRPNCPSCGTKYSKTECRKTKCSKMWDLHILEE